MDQGLAYLRKVKKAVQKDKNAQATILSHQQELAARLDRKQTPCASIHSSCPPSGNSSGDLEPPSLQVEPMNTAEMLLERKVVLRFALVNGVIIWSSAMRSFSWTLELEMWGWRDEILWSIIDPFPQRFLDSGQKSFSIPQSNGLCLERP